MTVRMLARSGASLPRKNMELRETFGNRFKKKQDVHAQQVARGRSDETRTWYDITYSQLILLAYSSYERSLVRRE